MRIQFAKGRQQYFIDAVCRKLNKNLKELSAELNIQNKVGYSAVKHYHQERLLLPLIIAEELSRISNIEWENFEHKNLLLDNWGMIKGGKNGYQSLVKKYPHMLAKWRQIGMKKFIVFAGKNRKKVILPKMNKELAEFIGICLGDGTLTKYFLRISLDARYDLSYADYIMNLIFRIFGIQARLRKENGKNLIYVTLHSITVCEFLHEKCGLPFGDKIINAASIPKLIIVNPELIKNCIRGLIDTDGTIYRGDTVYFYSNNIKLIMQVKKVNSKLKIFTHVDDTRICTNSWPHTISYFRKIGSSNLKNVIRFSERYYKNKRIYVKDTPQYFKSYEETKLPFLLN